MKHMTMLLALLLALGFGSQTVLAQTMAGQDDQPGFVSAEPRMDPLDDEEMAAFETENLVEDDYGFYDEDYAWDVIDEDYDAWYGEEAAHYNWWGTYDDPGEEGLFDW